jgi:predicted MPP superfamily phosphohydrolase
MIPYARHLPSLTILAVSLGLQFVIWRWWMTAAKVRSSTFRKCLVTLATGISVAVLLAGFSLRLLRVIRVLPPGSWISVVRGVALGWALALPWLFLAVWLWRRAPAFDARRRRLLKVAGAAALSVPAVAGGLGVFIARTKLQAREVEIRLDGLPPDLDGLRLAQLTDIHLSPFLSVKELARAVGMANEWRPHLALVTGDLITDRGDPLDECLRELARLRASDGIFGCLGNHEGYVRAESYCAVEGYRQGIRFLRSETRYMRFGGAGLNLAGVDYQSMGGPYLAGLEQLVRQDRFNVLLSHSPDAFPAAVRQGYRLVISGHTHGGQLAFEGTGVSFSVSRLFTPYVHGLYREKDSAVYVSRGIGTVGIPVRLGAVPEVTLIRLCAS